jgi:glycerophosphoryl diester phosphodiesterase
MALPPLFAHRLGRAYGPDSSFAALERALAGCDGVETDVCMTADEELVLLHDPLLSAGTNLQGWVHQHSFDRIRREAVLLDRDRRPTGERPLSLDELLDATPRDMPVQVDIKAHADPELAARTARVVCERYARTRRRGRVEVISFHSSACAVAAAHGFASRLVVFADYAPEALATWASRHGVGGVSVEHFLLTTRLARVFRLAGLSVNTGTINDAELLLRVVRAACPDAVCSDRPAELRREARLLDEGAAARQLPNAAVA